MLMSTLIAIMMKQSQVVIVVSVRDESGTESRSTCKCHRRKLWPNENDELF